MYEIRCNHFDISIFLVIHFLLVRNSSNHILANFEKTKFGDILSVLISCKLQNYVKGSVREKMKGGIGLMR